MFPYITIRTDRSSSLPSATVQRDEKRAAEVPGALAGGIRDSSSLQWPGGLGWRGDRGSTLGIVD